MDFWYPAQIHLYRLNTVCEDYLSDSANRGVHCWPRVIYLVAMSAGLD